MGLHMGWGVQSDASWLLVEGGQPVYFDRDSSLLGGWLQEPQHTAGQMQDGSSCHVGLESRGHKCLKAAKSGVNLAMNSSSQQLLPAGLGQHEDRGLWRRRTGMEAPFCLGMAAQLHCALLR